ncbi:MAG: SpvB/TcaC N-terminal domain-containing protein [Treponemataceae bacterium]|nr:SpvB/TcaC N-terminal domain-containing protein [Spirochaetales bacterium]MDY6031637.1 SpvB/TcaC N-terminal domain-containing protein [Treponemataceae bacterium]
MKNSEKPLSKFEASLSLLAYIVSASPVQLVAQEKVPSYHESSSKITKESTEKVITSENGGVIELGNAKIEIPAGAVEKDTVISIERRLRTEETGESIANVLPGKGCYRFLPKGTEFAVPVEISLPYDEMLNSKKQSLEELYTYFFDTEKNEWVKLERVKIDEEKCLVVSRTTHFTDMINATLTLPESASPSDINLNSIKNLEAAKPDGHLIKFNPPKASNTGDAEFSFEFDIPSGRRGMQPSVSVSYSSTGGNGIMGKGFDLNYGSSITIDTRLSLPKYNGNDRYMLDGILLQKVETSSDGKVTTYSPLKESDYKLIEHYTDGNDDYWQVTDKSGNLKRYGSYKLGCKDENGQYFSDGDARTGTGSNTFKWNITENIDIKKNTIIYKYENNGGYSYPKKIYYTGKKSKLGQYHVEFKYRTDRKDVRVDSRSKSFVSTNYLLSEIQVNYKDNPCTRKYQFNYNSNFNGESIVEKLTVFNSADESYDYKFCYEGLSKNNQGQY